MLRNEILRTIPLFFDLSVISISKDTSIAIILTLVRIHIHC